MDHRLLIGNASPLTQELEKLDGQVQAELLRRIILDWYDPEKKDAWIKVCEESEEMRSVLRGDDLVGMITRRHGSVWGATVTDYPHNSCQQLRVWTAFPSKVGPIHVDSGGHNLLMHIHGERGWVRNHWNTVIETLKEATPWFSKASEQARLSNGVCLFTRWIEK